MSTKQRPDILTTGEAAALLGLSQQQIIRLIDRGELLGWKVPLSSHRRVSRSQCVVFAHKHGIPLESKEWMPPLPSSQPPQEVPLEIRITDPEPPLQSGTLSA